MPGTSPIRLGSAASGWTFESGSSIETSESGIQSISVKALWPIGNTILSNLPAYGASVSVIETTGYIPSSFLLDRIDKGAGIEYLEGGIARATFTFKRQDPNNTASYRQVHVDTIVNYKNNLQFPAQLGPDGNPVDSSFGFPEPVCTVRYSSVTQPLFSDGMHALPGTARATDFPPVPVIGVPYKMFAGVGSVVSYFNGTAWVTFGPLLHDSLLTFSLNYSGNPSGWQLTKLRFDPVCARSFFDVEEIWRNFYVASGVSFVGSIPPLPPP